MGEEGVIEAIGLVFFKGTDNTTRGESSGEGAGEDGLPGRQIGELGFDLGMVGFGVGGGVGRSAVRGKAFLSQRLL